MPRTIKIKWLTGPKNHDYPAAESYLTLIYPKKAARSFVRGLKNAVVEKFKAKDIFRASGLPLLGSSNSQVKKNRKRISAGKAISPILLVRQTSAGHLIIADGYHRLCAVYSFDEDALIPCKIA